MVTDTVTDEETPTQDVSTEDEVVVTPLRLIEMNDLAWFPQAAQVTEELVVDDPVRVDMDSFEPFLPVTTPHWATNESFSTQPATPDPTPVTTALPGGIGLPNSSATGQTPFFPAPTAPDAWRHLWQHARRLPSVIVLPNLAPPG
jgi:hypothetical protein